VLDVFRFAVGLAFFRLINGDQGITQAVTVFGPKEATVTEFGYLFKQVKAGGVIDKRNPFLVFGLVTPRTDGNSM